MVVNFETIGIICFCIIDLRFDSNRRTCGLESAHHTLFKNSISATYHTLLQPHQTPPPPLSKPVRSSASRCLSFTTRASPFANPRDYHRRSLAHVLIPAGLPWQRYRFPTAPIDGHYSCGTTMASISNSPSCHNADQRNGFLKTREGFAAQTTFSIKTPCAGLCAANTNHPTAGNVDTRGHVSISLPSLLVHLRHVFANVLSAGPF